jgi:hypothetical protein
VVVIPQAGHAPALMDRAQVDIIARWLESSDDQRK